VIDHVTIRVSDLAASGRFYGRVFELLEFPGDPYADESFHEWWNFSIAQATAERPPARQLHVGFTARTREHVDEWWRALTEDGYPSDGEPGPRRQYGPEYYGAFVLDPNGNSVEAVHNPPLPRGVIDHLWLRVRDPGESRRFYETIAPVVGLEIRALADRMQVRAGDATFSVLAGEPTEHVHLAFSAPDRETVDAFHRAGVEAGYRSNGEPGERPEYHAGYYGAYLLDPDGHNIEAVFHDRRASP
jgi:catechol 2,3-dioxygenase-like lactoylglutathione lyase family enzyme